MISITSDCYQPIFSLLIDINFGITSDFSIHLMQLTSKIQTPITFLFVNKTSSVCRHFLSKNMRKILVPK